MPQPVSGTFRRSPNVLLQERPEHAARIGLVVAEWASLEDELIDMFAFSLFALSAKERGAHQVAQTMLERIESLTVRLEVMSGVLKPRVSADEHKYFMETLRPEIRKRAGERNKVAHSNWRISDDEPNYVITLSPEGFVKYSCKDFEEIANRIIETSNKISSFLRRVMRAENYLALAHAKPPQPLLGPHQS